jgi:hypothetical protein
MRRVKFRELRLPYFLQIRWQIVKDMRFNNYFNEFYNVVHLETTDQICSKPGYLRLGLHLLNRG